MEASTPREFLTTWSPVPRPQGVSEAPPCPTWDFAQEPALAPSQLRRGLPGGWGGGTGNKRETWELPNAKLLPVSTNAPGDLQRRGRAEFRGSAGQRGPLSGRGLASTGHRKRPSGVPCVVQEESRREKGPELSPLGVQGVEESPAGGVQPGLIPSTP